MTAPINHSTQQSPGIFRVTLSILLSLIGLQRSKTLESDIKHGKASTFIIAGIMMVALFVLMVCGIVKLVLPVGH